MVTIEREKLEQVLEALERYQVKRQDFDRFAAEITVIKQTLVQPAPPPECKTEAEQTAYAFGWWKALELAKAGQPAQEPLMIFVQPHKEGNWCDDLTCKKCYSADFRFKHQKRSWVDLTSEQIESVFFDIGQFAKVDLKAFARAILSKSKELNT